VSGAGATRERTIRTILDDLIRQRRRIEQTSDDEELRRANRLSIAYWQAQLSRALAEQGERHEAA
jgi:hypothetical protein